MSARRYSASACALALALACAHTPPKPEHETCDPDECLEKARTLPPGDAAPFYSAACDGGIVDACVQLSELLGPGGKLPPDPTRRAHVAEKACRAGSPKTCLHAADAYADGRVVVRDDPRAAELYDRGCAGEDRVACARLAAFRREGRGGAKDLVAAERLYRRSCEAGELSSCVSLARMFAEGTELGRNLQSASELYRVACEGKSPEGCLHLSEVLEIGESVIGGVREKACKAGFKLACPRTPSALIAKEKFESTAGLDRDAIAEVLARHARGVRFCLATTEAEPPKEVVVRFVIRPGGEVGSAEITSPGVTDETLAECITGQIRTWKFPPPDAGTEVTITWRVT